MEILHRRFKASTLVEGYPQTPLKARHAKISIPHLPLFPAPLNPVLSGFPHYNTAESQFPGSMADKMLLTREISATCN
jgi:hypothetical protein